VLSQDSPCRMNRTDMESNDLQRKLNGILEAIASGRTCEQILATDRSLSYHDIFHAVAEAPTSYWNKASAQNPGAELPQTGNPVRMPVKRVD
jgi:hypothetical protein